jgi:hypothetical protein
MQILEVQFMFDTKKLNTMGVISIGINKISEKIEY